MQRFLLITGIVLVLVALLWPWLSRVGLGRLPGDILIEGERSKFYFPIVTCLVVSAVLTVVIWLFQR